MFRFVGFIIACAMLASCGYWPRMTATPSGSKKPVWTAPFVVGDTDRDYNGQPISNPAIVVDGQGAINVVYWAKGFGEVYFARSTDGGRSFTPPVNVSNDALGSDHPKVAVGPEGNIYIVWNNLLPLLPSWALFSVSKDQGRTWSEPKNISNNPRRDASRANIAVDPSGTIYVVWHGIGRVIFTKSSDQGGTWTDPKPISGNHPVISVHPPSIAIDRNGRIYAAWSVIQGEPYTAYSDDGGESFGEPIQAADTKPSLYASIAVDAAGGLYLVWTEGSSGSTEVLFARSTDGGKTFSAPLNISNSKDISSMDPRVKVSRGGTVWVIWNEILIGNSEIFGVYSTDGGRTFSPSINISNAPGNAALPEMTLDPEDALNLVWEHGMKRAIHFSKTVKP